MAGLLRHLPSCDTIMGNRTAICCGSKPRPRKPSNKAKNLFSSVDLRQATSCPPSPASSYTTFETTRWNSTEIIKQVEACEQDFYALIDRTEATPLPLHAQKPGIQIYGTDTSRGFLMKSVWTSTFSPEVVLAFAQNNFLRLSWDPNLAERRTIGCVTEEIRITYERYKKILGVAQRDMLSAGKMCRLRDGSLLDWSVSVEIAELPVVQDVIRAHLYLGGYHIQATPQGSLIALYNEVNYGGALPNKLLVPMSARTMLSFVQSFNTALAQSNCLAI